MAAQRLRDDRLFVLSAIGSVILLAGLAWPFFVGEIYASRDLGKFHIPVRWFYAQALAAGDDWLWFPYGYGGYYVHGEGQGTLAHPLNWLGYRLLGFHAAFAVEFMRSWVLLVIGFTLALGEKGLLSRLLDELPLVGLFRAPSRYVLLTHVGLAVAASVGFADLAKTRGDVRDRSLRSLWPLACVPLASLVVTAVALVFLTPFGNATRVTGDLPGIVAGPLLALLASALVAAAVFRPRLALPLLVLFAAADLGTYGSSYVRGWPPVELASWARLDEPPDVDAAFRKEVGRERESMRGVRLAVG